MINFKTCDLLCELNEPYSLGQGDRHVTGLQHLYWEINNSD